MIDSVPSNETFGTKADEIRQQLEELIVAGKLAPGAVLRQDELAERFEVSRTPIREALRQLATLGLVTFVPNRGVRVRALDKEEWSQKYRARAALEGVAAECAASTITEAELDELDLADDDFTRQIASLRRRDLSASSRSEASFKWIAANERFHHTILRSADLPVFEVLIIDLQRAFSGEASWAKGSAADTLYDSSLREHAAIRAALRIRDGAAARVLMEHHILASWRKLQAVVDESASTTDGDWSPLAH